MGSGWLVQRYGWAMPFYVFGSVGLLWLILWFRQVENDPAADPRLGAEERELLQAARPATHLAERVPLRRLLLRACASERNVTSCVRTAEQQSPSSWSDCLS